MKGNSGFSIDKELGYMEGERGEEFSVAFYRHPFKPKTTQQSQKGKRRLKKLKAGERFSWPYDWRS